MLKHPFSGQSFNGLHVRELNQVAVGIGGSPSVKATVKPGAQRMKPLIASGVAQQRRHVHRAPTKSRVCTFNVTNSGLLALLVK
jgi:hypothetical protein